MADELRYFRGMSASTPDETARARLRAIDAEVVQIRGPAPVPALQADPMSPAGTHRLMELLAEAAIHHLRLRELDESRRAVADAILYMTDVKDEAAIARASLLTGEALIELDSPKHAKTRLEVAAKFYGALGDEKLSARSRVALGRALILLDDPEGIEMIRQVQHALIARGDAAALARVEALLEDVRTGGSSTQTVRAGYGRAVSIPPPAR